MLTKIYVIDYLVRDLEAAKHKFDRVFATEPLWIEPSMSPGVQLKAIYYQTPGHGQGLHAVGIFDRSGDAPKEGEDGVELVGILCGDVDGTVAEIQARGVKFGYPSPQRYAVGRNNVTHPLNGIRFSVAQHDEDGYEAAQRMMKTAAGSTVWGDETQGGLLLSGGITLDVAVHDLDDAIANYRAFLGVEPEAIALEEGLRSVRFLAPGNGASVDWIRFHQPMDGVAASRNRRRVDQFLQRNGEGIFRVGFRVSDIDRMAATLTSRGLEIEPAASETGFTPHGVLVPDLCGVDLVFAAHSMI